MATLLGQARIGDISIRSSSGGFPVLEETWSFIVRADSVNEDRLDIQAATGMTVGLTTVADGFAVCRGISGSFRPDNPLIWDFTAEFSSEVEENSGGGDPESDPEAWVPVYRTKFERIVEAASTDINDDAIANSAGQPFEVGVMIPRYIPIWEFYQFEPASVSDEVIIARNEVVNSGVFLGRAAKTLLCSVMSSEIGFYYGARRRLTQYQLKYNFKNWRHKRQDTGTVYLDGSDLLPYLDDGTPPNVILGPLDGSGAKATAGDPPFVLEFDIYNAVDFSSFLRV
jgi:hypothetical protein